MSYARWGVGSDVYFYKHVDGGFQCVDCPLGERPEEDSLEPGETAEVLDDYPSAIRHLERHVAAGHRVPPYALARLVEESYGRRWDERRDPRIWD
jgi:hypothetical protein